MTIDYLLIAPAGARFGQRSKRLLRRSCCIVHGIVAGVHATVRTRVAPGFCLAFSIFAPIRVIAAEPELMAVLSVMGYGYKVKLTINGVDPGIEGGKSEGRRLFNKGSEMAKKVSPQIRAKNLILNQGANDIAVEYVKIDPTSNDELEIKIEAGATPSLCSR